MDSGPLKVLLVEDNEDDYIIVRDLLEESETTRFELNWVEEYQEGLRAFETDPPHICLVDYRLGEATGLDLLLEVRQRGLDTPIILMTGQGDHDVDMKAMQAGAADYLIKDQLQGALLERSIRYALEHQHHAEVLRESEERFRATFEQAAVGIALITPHGEWLRANERLSSLLGYSHEELMQCSLPQLTYADDVEVDRDLMCQVLAGEIPTYSVDKRFCHKAGHFVWANMTVSLVREPSGEPKYFIIVVEDITVRKQAEESLRAKEEEVRATSQQLWQTAKLATMGELAASIAHELNNPMATVSLHIESLLMELPEDSPQRWALGIIEGEVERMSGLVAHLLQFSRRSQQQVSTLDVQQEIEKTLELVQFYLRNRHVTVTRDFANEPPLVQADPQQLRQLLLNLFTNASDAMPEGGTLTLRVRPVEDTIVTEVADTGTGIAPEDLPRVLEPFFTTKPEGKGTGLGLPICRRIVNEHSGTFEIDSQVGQGTTMRFILPAAHGSYL